MRREQLAHSDIFGTQDVAEIAKTSSASECAGLFWPANVHGVEAERRARRHQVHNSPIDAVTDVEHADLYRHIAVGAVIFEYIIADPLGGDQLAHQPIVIDADIVNQPVDLITVGEGDAHQSAKGRRIGL